jgi:hypothetical protein
MMKLLQAFSKDFAIRSFAAVRQVLKEFLG